LVTNREKPLKIIVLYDPNRSWVESVGDARTILETAARLYPIPLNELEHQINVTSTANAVLLLDPFAVLDHPDVIAAFSCPFMVNFQPLMWHSYDAIARTFLKRVGIPVLPSDSQEALENSLSALAAQARLAGEKAILFVGQRSRNQNSASVQRLPERTGIQVELRDVDELKACAAAVSFTAASDVLNRWKQGVFNSIHPNIPDKHLIEIARLYVAEKRIADEVGATALAVEEFAPFLFQNHPMPNITYAILKNEGVLTAEEADFGVLATMILLRALTGEANTMANVYLAWRDEYERINTAEEYTASLMRKDYQQCLRDGTVVISHFGSAGSLPLNMMEGSRYDVIETTPPWPSQSMLSSIPRLGAVILTRLHDDGETLDMYPGEGVAIRTLKRDDWLRTRWMVQLDAQAFKTNAIHAHWAISRPPPQQALEILCSELLKISVRWFSSQVGVKETYNVV